METIFETDIRSKIIFSDFLEEDQKQSLLRHLSYLTPTEIEELKCII